MTKFPDGNLSEDEWEEIDTNLRDIQGCDLSAWDQDFVDDMIARFAKYGTSTQVTGRQWEQFQRLKEQYL